MSKNKKPTMMEVKNVLSNLITQTSRLDEHIAQLDFIIARYFEFKGDKDKFQKWLEKNVPHDKEKKDE